MRVPMTWVTLTLADASAVETWPAAVGSLGLLTSGARPACSVLRAVMYGLLASVISASGSLSGVPGASMACTGKKGAARSGLLTAVLLEINQNNSRSGEVGPVNFSSFLPASAKSWYPTTDEVSRTVRHSLVKSSL